MSKRGAGKKSAVSIKFSFHRPRVFPAAPMPPPIFVTNTGITSEPALWSIVNFPLFRFLKPFKRVTTIPRPLNAVTQRMPAINVLNTAFNMAGCFAMPLRADVSKDNGLSSPVFATAINAVCKFVILLFNVCAFRADCPKRYLKSYIGLAVRPAFACAKPVAMFMTYRHCMSVHRYLYFIQVFPMENLVGRKSS